MADACVFLMERGAGEGLYNVGAGTDVTIWELAEAVMKDVGFDGELVFDTSRPDDMMLKRLDVSRPAALGSRAKIGLEEGLRSTYDWYCRNGVQVLS